MQAIALFILALGALPTFADLPREAMGQSPVVDGKPAVAVTLLSSHDTVVPGGTARLGVHLALSPNWHIYGANPGSAGFPTTVQWQVTGGTVGALTYPPPKMFKESDDVFTYGYSGATVLTAALQVADDAQGPVVLQAHIKYLACNIICSPGEVHLRRTLPLTPPVAQEAPAAVRAALTAEQPAHTDTAQDIEGSDHEAPVHLAQALGLALCGGLVLNLMPCVLPVLALKAMALMQASRSRREQRRHGLFYGLGVVGTTLALGLVVMAIRAAGHSVGWGFQFQEPLFIAAVALGLLLFALSSFGLFEVVHGVDAVAQAHDRARGIRRSLLEGILAVLVATPCSAPFLGTAVAFALAQPDWVIALIFATIGAGLAAPFVLLAWVPGLGKFVPRPGPWMGHLKVCVGFGLLITCVWLVWLFGRARGVDDVAVLLLLMVGAAAGAWIIGLVSARAPGRLAPLLLVWVLALGWLGRMVLGPTLPAAHVAPAALAPFSPAVVAAELQAGRPVLVDFTADWCITCSYNERHVLADAEVQRALADHHVTVLRADFTRRDPEILRVLMSHGRAGVPMYLLYSPTEADKPLLLPELLTVKTLTAALSGL